MSRTTGTDLTFLRISDLKKPHPFHADTLKFLGFELLDEYEAARLTQGHGSGHGPISRASGEGDHQDQHKA
jgi:hypothetical protein